MRTRTLVLLVLVLVQGIPTPASALEMRSRPSARVPQTEVIDDDLYISGGTVRVDGRIRGDLITAGGTVAARGEVDGDVLAGGGTVEILGPVRASARVLGGSIVVAGAVGADVVAAGGTIELLPEARVARDMAVAGGTVFLRGAVGRHVRVAGGRVEIAGTIGGNLLVRGGEIILHPSAVVRGDFTYSSELPLQMAPGARVIGTVTQESYPVRPVPSRRAARGFRVAFGIADFLWMLAVSVVLLALAPRGVAAPAEALRARPWAAFGWGLLLLFGIPVAAVALFVMVIGIPISALLVVTHLMALFVGHTAAALAISRSVGLRASPYAQATVGVAAIAIATNLPYVGIFLRLVVIALGVGAAALALWSGRAAPPVTDGPTGPGAPAVA